MIDYNKIVKAQEYYTLCGYANINVPWTVSSGIVNITKPIDVPSDKGIAQIASGEQGFIDLFAKGYIPEGILLQTTTPCVRMYDEIDEIHTNQFLKTELFIGFYGEPAEDVLVTCLEQIHKDAKQCFLTFDGVTKENLASVMTKDKSNVVYLAGEFGTDIWSTDIEINGIEVGSYGIRKCKFGTWVYGTGLAEPRFSRAIGAK